MHARLCERHEFVLAKVRALAAAERRVFEASAELAKREDEEVRFRRELEQLCQYEQNMRELLTEVSGASDIALFQGLHGLVHRLHVAILTQKQREESALARAAGENAEQQLAELDKQIAEREGEMRELGERLLAANQRQMRVEESAALAEGRRHALGSTRAADETQRMLAMVMCPVCMAKQRNCIIRACRHAVCRGCLAAKGGRACPVCGHACAPSDVNPFLLGQGAPLGRAGKQGK
jgi:hypothetical protein